MRSLFIVFIVLIAITGALLAQDDDDTPLYEEIQKITAPSVVNVRDSASTTNAPIAILSPNQTVLILEEITDGQSVSGDSRWYRIQLDDEQEGFIWAGAVGEPFTDFSGQNTGDSLLLWSTLAPPELVMSIEGLTTKPITDETTCEIIGMIATSGSFEYYAIIETPFTNEIQFLNASHVTSLEIISDEQLETIQALHQTQTINNAETQALAEARQALLTGERIAFTSVDPGSRSDENYYTGDNPRISLISPSGGSIVPLLPNYIYAQQEMQWSSNGDRVFLYLSHNRTYNMGLFDLVEDKIIAFRRNTGSIRYLDWMGAMHWSPDDQTFAFVHEPVFSHAYSSIFNSKVTLISVDDFFDEHALTTITDDFTQTIQLYPLEWSPDGRNIVFLSSIPASNPAYIQSEIYMLNTETHDITYITSDAWYYKWSPDGKALLILSYPDNFIEGKYEIINMETLEKHHLADYTYVNDDYFQARWSPDSEQIAFITIPSDESYQTLYMIDRDGTNQQRLTEDLNVRGFAWSPDGSQLVFIAGNPDDIYGEEAMYIINRDGSNRLQIADGITIMGYTDTNTLYWLPALDG